MRGRRRVEMRSHRNQARAITRRWQSFAISVLVTLMGTGPLPVSATGQCKTSSPCIDNEADWRARSLAKGVFYANNFDYPDRAAYLAGAHSYHNPNTRSGAPKLELETRIKLSGRGASRHNWLLEEGANEAGPAWDYSFDGLGAKTEQTRKQRFYVQYAMYADEEWVNFAYQPGAIKNHILFDPSAAPFDHGEIVITRAGTGPWLHGFSVAGTSMGFFLMWRAPHFVAGDDTYYTFWNSRQGQADAHRDPPTDIDKFERHYGPRRRNAGPKDPDYDHVPRIKPGRWYVVEAYVDVDDSQSVLKIWFAERGRPPILLTGSMDLGIRPGVHTYRGGFLLNRAEDTPRWISKDTFVVFDELLVSDEPIAFPGGYELPWPGRAAPPNWPPPATQQRR